MHFIVMGCGRVGSAIAAGLESRGHTVAVIDVDSAAFRRLSPDFNGQKVTGVGFDRDVLRQAGIDEAEGFAAVSNGDNSNILAARVARETFGLKNVVARIYDPDRAEVYERLHIRTVATVPWTAEHMLRNLLPNSASGEYRDPSGQIVLTHLAPHPAWVGQTLARLEDVTETRAAFINRFGRAILPQADTVLQSGDMLYLLIPTAKIGTVERLLAQVPEEDN